MYLTISIVKIVSHKIKFQQVIYKCSLIPRKVITIFLGFMTFSVFDFQGIVVHPFILGVTA